MKIKNLYILSVLVVLLAVVGCATSDVAPAQVAKSGGSAVELYAEVASRTANDGINTLWSEGDKINVFHSLSGGDGYVDDGAFTLAEGGENRFSGKLNESSNLMAESSYDWFATYPYNASLSSPTGVGVSYIIGSQSTSYQQQVGNNSTAHMAGEYMPLVGVAKGVKAEDNPSITVKNVASMVEVVLQNNSKQNITLKSLSLSVPGHALVGSFRIDFSNVGNIVCSPISGEVSDVVTLKVEGGESIAPLSQASFYVAVAPCVAEVGDVITFDATLLTSEGEKLCSKSQTLTSSITFHSGKKKSATLNYDQELKIVELPVDGLPPMQGGDKSRIFRVRAMSYNVRNCKGEDGVVDYKRVADAIDTYDRDVVALQELDSMTTRYQNQDVLKNLADYTGMYPTFGAARDYNGGKYGVGVLTKQKPLSHYCVPLPCSSEPRVLLVVELEDYYFCSTHFSLLAEYRSQAADIIVAEAKKLNKPMIVAGDMNALRSEASMQTLAEHFFVFEKMGSRLTFPADNPTKEIDYICLYADNGAAAVVYESRVLFEPVASDHRPVVIDMTICE